MSPKWISYLKDFQISKFQVDFGKMIDKMHSLFLKIHEIEVKFQTFVKHGLTLEYSMQFWHQPQTWMFYQISAQATFSSVVFL